MMRMYWFSFKRLSRSLVFPLLMILCTALIAVSPLLGREENPPPAGVYSADDSVLSARVISYLRDNGFLLIDSEEQLRQMIREGVCDCGAVLPADFGQRIETGDVEDSIQWLESPVSVAAQLYKNHVSAAIFREYAPYITASALEGTSVTRDEVLAEYEGMMERGLLFSFALSDMETSFTPENARAKNYQISGAALLLFLSLSYSFSGVMTGEFAVLSARIGTSAAVRHVVIPAAVSRILWAAIAVCGGLVLSGVLWKTDFSWELLPGAASYAFFAASSGMLLCACLSDARQSRILAFFTLLLSLVLCPVYADLAVLYGWIRPIRLFAVPYWMWIAADSPALCAAVGGAVFAAAVAVLLLRGRVKTGIERILYRKKESH